MKKSEDLTRKCKKGHEPDWYVSPKGWVKCRECRRNEIALFKQRYPEKVKETQRKSRLKHIQARRDYDRQRNQNEERKRQSKNSRLLKKYGITLQEFESKIKEQNGLCPICLEDLHFESRQGAVVDHCHETNKIRGIIHGQCNILLGMACDNEATLLRAINYLKILPS